MPLREINYDNFHMAFGGVKDLTHGWMDSAKVERDVYKSFLLAWIAFNSWMTAVTGVDREWQMNAMLVESGRLSQAFGLMAQSHEFSPAIASLFNYFPIYDGRAYRRKAASSGQLIPDDLLQFRALGDQWNIEKSPKNWLAGNVPTWRDCLPGLYRIRCNLFHGQKQQTNQGDAIVVRHGLEVLIGLSDRSGFLRWNGSERVHVNFNA